MAVEKGFVNGEIFVGDNGLAEFEFHNPVYQQERIAVWQDLHDIIDVEPTIESFSAVLAPAFQGTKPNEPEENLQSRSRGVILMALSNKFGPMVLSTGNKSEMAVGYATLYGDMNGGFNPIKDLYKTRNMRPAFKSGFWAGGMKAGMMMLTGGAFPGGRIAIGRRAACP